MNYVPSTSNDRLYNQYSHVSVIYTRIRYVLSIYNLFNLSKQENLPLVIFVVIKGFKPYTLFWQYLQEYIQ